jgi:hypothetical protein
MNRAKWYITALIVGWALTAAAGFAAVVTERAQVLLRVEANEEHIEDHEQRLRKLEQVAADVRWIREHLANE